MHKIIFMHYRQQLGFESAGPSENYYAYFTLSDANLAETIGVTMQGYHEMLQKIWISYLHCF